MNDIDRKALASFVAQRMEMGETEWFFKPQLGAFSGGKRTVPQPATNRPAHAIPGKPAVFAQQTTAAHNECVTEDISKESINVQKTLDDLNTTVCGCMNCALGATRTKFVFGSGNPDADIMFVGEAPGRDEDEQGEPFIGRAGKLLTKMIEAIKLQREDVYIANILKCRPPQNRDPQAGEIEQCEPILIRQIELIKPAIICAVGRIAGQTLLRTKSTLGDMREKIHDYHGVKLMVTYHPAALLRNPNWKPKAWDDLKFLRREYDGMEIV